MGRPAFKLLKKDSAVETSKRRQDLLRRIDESPGIHLRELGRQTGLKNGTLTHHVKVLGSFGLVHSRRDGRRVRLYTVNHPAPRAAFDEDIGTAIESIVEKSPGISRPALQEQLRVKRTTLLYHLDSLAADHRITSKRVGRQRCYWPTQGPGALVHATLTPSSIEAPSAPPTVRESAPPRADPYVREIHPVKLLHRQVESAPDPLPVAPPEQNP